MPHASLKPTVKLSSVASSSNIFCASSRRSSFLRFSSPILPHVPLRGRIGQRGRAAPAASCQTVPARLSCSRTWYPSLCSHNTYHNSPHQATVISMLTIFISPASPASPRCGLFVLIKGMGINVERSGWLAKNKVHSVVPPHFSLVGVLMARVGSCISS